MNEFTSANCPGYTSDEIQKMNRELSQKLEDHGLSASDLRHPGNAATVGLIVQTVFNNFNAGHEWNVRADQAVEISKLRDELAKAYETCETIARDHAARFKPKSWHDDTLRTYNAIRVATSEHIADLIMLAAPK